MTVALTPVLKSEDTTPPCPAKPEPDSPTSTPAPSPNGLFHIYGYHPFGGAPGAPITVSVAFACPANVTTFLRLVVGRKAMSTAVRAVGHAWELEARAPLCDARSPRVAPLSAQALNTDGDVLDSLTFGTFTYYNSPALSDLDAPQRPTTYASSSSDTEPEPESESSLAVRRPKPAPSRHSPYAPRSRRAPAPSAHPNALSAAPVHLNAASKPANAIALTRRAGAAQAPKAVLELASDLDAMCAGWSAEERRSGRRLVRFTRVQHGRVIRAFCAPIRADAYRHTDAVVSCIRRPDARAGGGSTGGNGGGGAGGGGGGCCITSVDVIALLEHLAGAKFGIDEKNRIRRNLEGFRPKTVSKNKAASQKFFQMIMDFPVPKPRNIEKDVKVFDWAVLPQALEKIVSKYSLESVDVGELEYSASPKLEQEQLPHSMSYSPQEEMQVLDAGLMLSPPHSHPQFSHHDPALRTYALAPQSYPPSPLDSPYDTAFPPDAFYAYPDASSLQPQHQQQHQASSSAYMDSPYDPSGYLVDASVQSYSTLEPPLDHTSPYIS